MVFDVPFDTPNELRYVAGDDTSLQGVIAIVDGDFHVTDRDGTDFTIDGDADGDGTIDGDADPINYLVRGNSYVFVLYYLEYSFLIQDPSMASLSVA